MADLRTSLTSLIERFTKRGGDAASAMKQGADTAKAHAIDEGDPTRTIVSDDPSRNPDNR